MLPVLFSLHQHVPCTTIVCKQSLSSDASLISQATQPAYQAPIIITQGGTYSGNWQSLDPNVPAVTIKTSQPVVIENSNLKGRGHLIDAYNAFIPINLTVRNTNGYGLNPNVYGQVPGRFLMVSLPVNIVVEHCYMESTGGISLYDGSQFQSVKIRYNRVRNIDGRKSNGNGGFLTGQNDFGWSQFVQLNQLLHAPGLEIAWNEVINQPYNSRVEDNISVLRTGGTSASPLVIHDNYIQGAYAADPINDSYTGGGIMLGDDSGTAAGTDVGFVKAYNNQVVSSSNYGLAIAAGHDNEIRNNRVVFSGQLADGTHPPGGMGVYVWDEYNNSSKGVFYNNFADNNTIGAVNGKTGSRSDTWFPNCAQNKCTNNTSLPSPITLNTEKAEYQTWQNKIASQNVKIGPQQQQQQVTVYRDFNFSGVSQSYPIGVYRADQGGLSTVGNDAISSLRVPSGLKVHVCNNVDGSGLCRDYGPGDYSNVGNDINDQISYIDVEPS